MTIDATHDNIIEYFNEHDAVKINVEHKYRNISFAISWNLHKEDSDIDYIMNYFYNTFNFKRMNYYKEDNLLVLYTYDDWTLSLTYMFDIASDMTINVDDIRYGL